MSCFPRMKAHKDPHAYLLGETTDTDCCSCPVTPEDQRRQSLLTQPLLISPPMTTYIADLQARLDARAEKPRREWWERYLKGVIPFRGVDMSGIRAAVREWFDDNDLVKLPRDERINLAWELLRRKLAEDKLAGILLMQEILLPARDIDWPTDLAAIVSLFDEGHIADWSTCDWLCVRVLGPLADQQGEQCAREIASWSTTANLWRRRAAGVAFVNIARRDPEPFPGFRHMLLNVCNDTVRSTERFAQTGTGWVLREISKVEPDVVVDFVEAHVNVMSREGVRYATAKLSDRDRTRLLDLHSQA